MGVNRIFDILGAIVVLAGITAALQSSETKAVIRETTSGFASILRVARGG